MGRVRMPRKFERRPDTSQKRHTHATSAGLEDAIAIVLDLLFMPELNEYVQASLRSLHTILKTLRAGPNAYNLERPSGERVIIRRRFINK